MEAHRINRLLDNVIGRLADVLTGALVGERTRIGTICGNAHMTIRWPDSESEQLADSLSHEGKVLLQPRLSPNRDDIVVITVFEEGSGEHSRRRASH